jgi:integrase
MASVFRIPRSPFYFAAFRDAMGRRCQRTTKTRERAKALRIALEFERTAAQGRDGMLTEAACRKVISQLHEQTTGKPIAFYSVESWIKEWLANCAGTTAPRTLERYAGTCRDFLAALGERAKVSLAALTVEDLREYRDGLKKQGHSPATCNQSLKILRAPLEEARRLGHVPVNPALGIKALKDEGGAKREAFTAEQIAMLFAAAKDTDWQGCILFGAFCGLRLKDAANVTWSCLDLEAGLLKMKTAKRGVGVTVPLHPALLEWLAMRPRGIGKAPVMPSLAGKSGSGKSGLSMAFKRIMVRTGIIGEIARHGHGAGRTTTTLSFHSTRHFFVSALSASGVPADVRQRLAGHTDAKTHAVYAAHEIESMRAAVSKLPNIGGAAT